MSHHPVIELSRLSVKVIAKQQRPSIPFTLSSSFHLFSSSLKIEKVQHWIKRNGDLKETDKKVI